MATLLYQENFRTYHITASNGTWTYPDHTHTTASTYTSAGGKISYAGYTETATSGDMYSEFRLFYDGNYYYYGNDPYDQNWYVIDNATITPITHAQRMQYEINRQWADYCNEERRAEEAIERRKLVRLANKAEDTAIILLKDLIGEDETEIYKKSGRLFVRGKNGVYFAKKGGGISKIEGNKIIDFCIHIETRAKCPPTDHAIALKLMLEEDDKKVIQIANRMNSHIVEKLPLAACM